MLLRRVKDDVETLPAKDEMILRVALTPEQRSVYRAVYENKLEATHFILSFFFIVLFVYSSAPGRGRETNKH